MTKYAEKYPYPGPRPPEEGSPGERGAGFDDMYRAYRGRAERMTRWQEAMRKHAVALAIDDVVKAWEGLGEGGVPAVVVGAGLGLVVVWLAFLGERLPPELFP